MRLVNRILSQNPSKEQVHAFKEMANQLIFLEPTHTPIGPTTIREISQMIQQDYLALYLNHQQSIGKSIGDLIIKFTEAATTTFVELPSGKEPPQQPNDSLVPVQDVSTQTTTALDATLEQCDTIKPSSLVPITREMTVSLFEEKCKKDAILDYHESCDLRITLLSLGSYHAAGFSPALTRDVADDTHCYDIPMNCCGRAFLQGSMYRLRDSQVYMTINPHHPVVLRYINHRFHGKEMTKHYRALRGFITSHDSFHSYQPTLDDGIPSPLSLIMHFDDAVVYELLENIEFLRQVALGNYSYFLPNSDEAMIKVAKKHEHVLKLTDWRKLQQLLFPDVADWMSRNHDAWEHAINWGHRHHHENHVRNIFGKHLDNATSVARVENEVIRLDSRIIQKHMLEALQKERELVIPYLQGSETPPVLNYPKASEFLVELKKSIVTHPEVAYRAYCMDYLIAKIFDKDPFS